MDVGPTEKKTLVSLLCGEKENSNVQQATREWHKGNHFLNYLSPTKRNPYPLKKDKNP